MSTTFGYRCEYCDGTVAEKRVAQEAFKHASGFVILEDVPIGICNICGNRYYSADLLSRVEAIARGAIPAERTEQVPVAHSR